MVDFLPMAGPEKKERVGGDDLFPAETEGGRETDRVPRGKGKGRKETRERRRVGREEAQVKRGKRQRKNCSKAGEFLKAKLP